MTRLLRERRGGVTGSERYLVKVFGPFGIQMTVRLL